MPQRNSSPNAQPRHHFTQRLQLPISDHEEQAWLLQQQQPEQIFRHLGAWRIDAAVDISRLIQSLQLLIEASPGLNVRYHFSDDGELFKTPAQHWHDCLDIIRCNTANAPARLHALRSLPWASDSQPPFQVSLIVTPDEVVLALLLHPILDDDFQLGGIADALHRHYAGLGSDDSLTSLFELPITQTRTAIPAQSAATKPPGNAGLNDVVTLILAEFRAALEEPTMQPQDDFFDFGGHSLLATRIIGKLQSKHGLEVRFNDFFQAPSAIALAERATRSNRVAAPAAATCVDALPADVRQAPLALAQASLWKAYKAHGFSTIFNLPFALELLDPVDEGLFRQAFSDVLERHTGLRTTFHGSGGGDNGDEPIQRIIPVAALDDYRWFWSSAQSEGASLAGEAAHVFDLARELPLRIRFLKTSPGERQRLSLLVHHMAIDEWSLNTVMADLAQAYCARAAGTAPAWNGDARSFCDFSLQQQREGINLQHLDYWVEMLQGATPGLQLSTTNLPAAKVEKPSTKAQWLEHLTSTGMADKLHAFARRHEASLFSVVYSAIALALHQQGNLKEIVIGTSASGRTDPAYFDTVGYFTTMVAHRVQFVPHQPVQAFIREVTRLINDSMPYADVPLAITQEAIGMRPEDGLLFDVYIQIHADNALNGAFNLAAGDTIRYKQISPDKTDSIFGLQFEIMEDISDGGRSLRLVVTWSNERYYAAQIDDLCSAITTTLERFVAIDDSGKMEGATLLDSVA